MFDKLVAGLLTSYLGEHFENIDTEQVKVSVWAGNVNLKRLTVRKDALRFFDVPFCVQQGFIEELVVIIPWTRLQSESVVFKMKGVRLVVHQKTYDNYPLAQRRKDADVRRQRDLEGSEEALLEEHFRDERERAAAAQASGVAPLPPTPSQSEEDRKNSTFSARLRANILNNIKVEMEDLQVRYETTDTAHATTTSAPPMASSGITFRLASLETFPCNSAYQKTFIAATDGVKVRMMHKMVVIKGVQVVLSDGTQQPGRPLTAPLSAALRVQYQPVALDRRAPTCLMGAQVDALSATVCQEDVQLLYSIVQDMCTPAEDDWERLKLRPLQKVHNNPRAWLRYAVQSVLLALRRKRQRTPFSWEAYKQFKAQRDNYARLYRRARRTSLGADRWLNPLTAREEVDFLTLEETLPVETIKLGRRLALARVTVERQEYAALKQNRLQQRQAKANTPAGAGTGPAAASTTTTTSDASATAPVEGSGPAAAAETDANAGGGGGWWQRWWAGAPNASVERAIEKEESAEVRAVMQETVELMSTTKWTEAQRLAIAKEFGISAQEADAMTEVASPTSASSGGGANKSVAAGAETAATLADSSSVHCVFKGVLCFTSATVKLARRPTATAASTTKPVAALETFADVHLQGLTVGTTTWDNGRLESIFCVHDLGIRGAAWPLIYLCTDDSASATPRAVPSTAQQQEHGERMVAQVLQDPEMSLVALAQGRTSGLSTPGVFLWGTREDPASLKRNEAPHHLHLNIHPIGVNVDVHLLYETVHFFLAAYKHVQAEQDEASGASAQNPYGVHNDSLVSSDSSADADGESEGDASSSYPRAKTDVEDVYIRSQMGIAAVPLLPIEARDLADPKSCLASLARKVEAAWVVDWSISLGSITLLVMEVDGEQGSRIHARDIQVQYDVQHQLKRAERLAASTSAAAHGSPTRSPGSDKDAFPVVTESPFGSEEEDWLNVITTSVSEYSLSCFFATSPSSGPQWQHVVEPMPAQLELKHNLMSRRNSSYPSLSTTISGDAPLHLTLSRSRLSVLCTSLSFLIDFVQRTMREVMMTRASGTAAGAPSRRPNQDGSTRTGRRPASTALDWEEKRLFRARLMAAEKRFMPSTSHADHPEDGGKALGEEEEAEEAESEWTTEAYVRQFDPVPLQPLEYRYMHVQRGALVVFHGMRPSYPHYCIELLQDHYHVTHATERSPSTSQSSESGAVLVNLYVEQGGARHDTHSRLTEARRARTYLKELFPIPDTVFAHPTLLRPLVADCLAKQSSSSPASEAVAAQVEAALESLEAAAHAIPCRHFQFRFDDAAEAAQLVACLRTAGLSRGLYTPTIEDYAALRLAVPEAIRDECLVQITFNFPACVIDLCEEAQAAAAAAATAAADLSSTTQLTFAPFIATASQGLQSVRYAVDTSEICLSADSSSPTGTPAAATSRTAPLFAVRAASDAASAAAPPVQLDCTLHTVPCNGLLPTRKVTNMNVAPGHVMAVRLSSDLLRVGELLWDLVGIATNRVFSATIVTAVPWWSTPEGTGDTNTTTTVQALEEAWVAAASCPERQQQLVRAALAAVTCEIYLPSDSRDEWAPTLVRSAPHHSTAATDAAQASTPLLSFEATNMLLEWRLDAAANRTHCSFESPLIKARVLTPIDPPTTTTSDGDANAAGYMLGTALQTLCAPGGVAGQCPLCTVDLTIPTIVPVLSLSDFLRNRSTADVGPPPPSPMGYRFTTSFALTAQALRVLYFQPQLMALLDVGTRGVMERALAVTSRPAYLFGCSSRSLTSAVLPAWSAQWAAMPPAAYNWTLMHKKVTLSQSSVLVPRSPEKAASVVDIRLAGGGAIARDAVFVLEVPTLEMVDRLQPAWSSTSTSSTVLSAVGLTTRIRFVNTVLKVPTSASGASPQVSAEHVRPASSLATVCPCLSLQVLLLMPLYDAARFVQGRHRESQMRFAPMMWRATSRDLADVVQGLFHQYMDKPALSPFAAKPFVLVDPFVTASLTTRGVPALAETSRTTSTVPQCCVHVYETGERMSAASGVRRDPISSALLFKGMHVSMETGLEGRFDCDAAFGEVSLWDLAHLGAKGTGFKADPAELCDASRAFMRLLPLPSKPRASGAAPTAADDAVRVHYGSQPGVSTLDATVGVLQLSLVPHFFFDARDAFGALAIRNAMGMVLRWPPHLVAGSADAPRPDAPITPVMPPPSRRRWHGAVAQWRLSIPDVLHNTLSPFLLFSVAGIDALDETDAHGALKERHLVIAQLTRNGMYVYPDELRNDSTRHEPVAPKLRVLFMPAVSMDQFRAHQDPPSPTSAARHAQGSARRDGDGQKVTNSTAPLSSPNTDLMDVLFGAAAPVSPDQAALSASRTSTSQHQAPPTQPPPAPRPHAPPNATAVAGPLFSCVHTPAEHGGLVIHLASTWLVVPHRHHVECLSSLWSQGGLSTLAELGTFLEDRASPPMAVVPPTGSERSTQTKAPSLFPRIRITVESPALVLPDRESNPGSATELQRGMLLSVGTIQFEKEKQLAPHSPTTPGVPARASTSSAQTGNADEHFHRVWRLRVPDIALYAISRPDEALLQPFAIALERWDDAPTAWGWRLHVEHISLQMEQRYYEMLLQTMVRNMFTVATTGAGTFQADSPSSRALDFAQTLRWYSTGPQTGHTTTTASTSTAAVTKAAAPVETGADTTGRLYSVAGDELGLRHPFPAYDADEESGATGGAGSATTHHPADHPMRVFQIQLKADGVELCVFGKDTAAYVRVNDVDVVSNAEWHLLPSTAAPDAGAGALPFRSPQRFMLQGRSRLVDRRRQVTARVGRVEVGLQQSDPLLLLVSSPVQHAIEDPDVVDVSAAAYFALDQKNLEETVEGHLGDGTLRLDSSVVATAIDFLYRPYARIVLPSYEVGEVIVLTRDRVLTEPLYLSQRATLRASGAVVNHIVLNAGGNEIHFMDEKAQGSAGAVLFIDEGVTLRIVNAILCLHGNALDYYIKAGNGGYVVVERQSCTTVTADEANVTVADVRQSLVTATVEGGSDVMDTLFGTAPAEVAVVPTARAGSTAATAVPAVVTATRRRVMRRYIIAASLRAEVPEPVYSHRPSATEAPNRTLSRMLVLTARLHCCIVDMQQGDSSGGTPGQTSEPDTCTGTFDLTHFALQSESRWQSGSGAKLGAAQIDRTDLISEWTVQVMYTSATTAQAVQHAYEVVAKKGLDVHIRYRDLFLCTAAVQQAQHALTLALGDVKAGAFSDVMGSLNAKSDQSRDVLRARANAVRDDALSAASTTTVNVDIVYCDIFLVNDQSAVDLPLFHVRVDHIRTPSSALTLAQKQWTVVLTLSVEFYDLSASSWYPCVEAVAMEFKTHHVVNLSVDELMARKGFDRLEVSVKPAKVYLSPLLLGAVRRALDVREAFEKEQAQLELYGPAAHATAAQRAQTATRVSTASETRGAAQFHSVSVRQELGVAAVRVAFAPALSGTHLDAGDEIDAHTECAFDYPRVGGKETDRSAQYIRLSVPPHSLVQRVCTFADGVAQIPLGQGRLLRHPVVEVSAVNGRKEVVLRSNVSFVNNLSFQLLLEGGVGCVHARGHKRLHVPVDLLSQRVRFLPNVAYKSDDCGLGIRYENLPALRGRTFLCMCPVEVDGTQAGSATAVKGAAPQMLLRTESYELRRSVQRHLYFLLRVRDATHRGAAAMEDVVGHFDAPLYVVNHLGLPIELQLMTQRMVEGKKVAILDISADRYVYDLVATVTVQPALGSNEKAHRQDITQLDPFQDIAMDVVVRLPNGAVLGRRLESRVSAGAPRPACVYAPQSPGRRDDRMTLVDPKTGSTLVISISYEGSEVHLSCPYWLLNDTSYPLQVSDMNPEKDAQIALIAGLQTGTAWDTVAPVGSQRQPYLYASERAAKLKEKAHLYVRVGVSGQGVLSWTRWSAALPIFAPVQSGVVACLAGNGVVMALSYSVEMGEGRLSETRIITVRPRWVLVNRTPRALSLRFASCGSSSNSGSGGGGGAALSADISVASTACHVFYRAPATAGVLSSGTGNSSTGNGSSSSTVNNDSNSAFMQLRFGPDSATGQVETCQWSSPFCISDEGEHAYNVRYRGLVKLEDYWPLNQGSAPLPGVGNTAPSPTSSFSFITRHMPDSLPPIRPEDIVERDRELYLRREDTTVVRVSCVTRASTTFVMINDATNPPFIIENRTDFMVWVRQDRLDPSVAVYPKRTKAYTWESEQLPMQMVLWATDGTMTRRSKEVRINFEPRALLQAGDPNFQQEVEMPTASHGMPCMLFVRVRGVHGASYAVSVTTEPTIDAYRTVPYRQFFYRLHLDALYAVLEDEQHADNMLLTVRPLHIECAQSVCPRDATRSSSASGATFTGDVQRIDVSLQTVQLDDERGHAKQKVVAQIVDDSATYCKYERYMLRSTPILYVPKCIVFACPIEFHIEDSYLYDVMQYGESLRLAWYGTREPVGETVLTGTSAAQGWMEEVATLSEQTPLVVDAKARQTPGWSRRVVFFGRLFIEKLLVSISLYRSPGAQNDPIWQRVGALSLLLRSVKDARLEWSRIDQRQVSEVVWVLLTKYSAFYRRRFQEQIPSLVNIMGIANVKGFFNKLVEDPNEERETQRRQKPRVGRRKEATLLKDSPTYKEARRVQSQFVVQADQLPAGLSAPPKPYSAAHTAERLRQRTSELVGLRDNTPLALPFAQMLRQLTTREDLLLFGGAAIRNAIVGNAATFDVSSNGNGGTARSAELVVAAHARASSTSPSSSCTRCGEVEAMVQQFAAADMPNPLPHPDEGLLSWAELTHHITWEAFVSMCTVPEVQQYGPLVRDAILGRPNNVIRLTA